MVENLVAAVDKLVAALSKNKSRLSKNLPRHGQKIKRGRVEKTVAAGNRKLVTSVMTTLYSKTGSLRLKHFSFTAVHGKNISRKCTLFLVIKEHNNGLRHLYST